MKKNLLTLTVIALLSNLCNAAISLGGTFVTNAKTNASSTTNIATGSVALLIVDTAGDGFFDFGKSVSNGTVFSTTAEPYLGLFQKSIIAGQTFGGEFILNRLASGAGSVSNPLTNVSIAGYLGKAFAIVIFDGILNSTSATIAPAGYYYTVVRGSDWVFPASDSGTFNANSTDSAGANSFFQVNAATPATGAVNFRTINGQAIFWTGAPEPSTTLLGAFGALTLLRRRRN